MSDRIRSAIIGAGFIGAVHARAVRAAGGTVSVVAAGTPERGAQAAQRLHADRFASAEEAVVAADVDLVHICTPNHLHAALAERALRAGKHVICEKPLATSTADAQRLTALAQEAGTVTAVPFVYRFYSTVRDARGRVLRGDTGPLRLLHGSYLQDWLSRADEEDWRTDPELGGRSRAFGDIGVHWCDLVEFTTGHRIVRLGARLLHVPRTVSGSRTEDGVVVQFETDRGALGSVVISQVSPGRKNRLWFSLDGSESSLQFDQEHPEELWIGGRGSGTLVPRGTENTTADAHPYDLVPAGHPQGYQDCFTSFVADVHSAIAGRRPEGLPDFGDGLRAARLTDAVLESAAADGAWTRVPTQESAHAERVA
ncbi:Gfo/Idh/MocA family oxidoreductase [Streptomyces sp. NPDC091215]|uniref:Gfo/Idh/MocA family protein n=1 Tax=Streptomyces sp. NPDC091215 TaxID=3155192 RepID=UPI00343BF144